MKKLFLSALAVLLLATGCSSKKDTEENTTSNASEVQETENSKEPEAVDVQEENVDPETIESVEIEEETEVDTEEGESSGGF